MTGLAREDIFNALRDASACQMCLVVSNDAMRQRLERLVRRGEVLRVLPSCYVEAKTWRELNPLKKHLFKVRTLAQKHPDWTFCGVSAAVVLGYDVSFRRLNKVHVVTKPSIHRKDTALVRFHRLDGIETTVAGGVKVTIPERTALDCMRTMPVCEGAAVADAAIRRERWDNAHLDEWIAEFRKKHRYRGILRSLLVCDIADGRSENGGESIARANMILAGFEAPELQVEIRNPVDPQQIFRADCLWVCADGSIVVGELDGRRKYTDENMLRGRDIQEVLFEERQRESRISALGAKVMRFPFEVANDRERLAALMDVFKVPRRLEDTPTTRRRRRNDRVRVRPRGHLQYRELGGYRLVSGEYDRVYADGHVGGYIATRADLKSAEWLDQKIGELPY